MRNYQTSTHSATENNYTKTKIAIEDSLREYKAEDILPCKMDQINAEPEGNWYRLAQKIDQQTVDTTGCQSVTRTRGDMKIGRMFRQGCFCYQFYSTSTVNTLPTKLLRGLETSK
jgi:hypothetical protein